MGGENNAIRFTEHSPDRMRCLIYRSAIEMRKSIHKLQAHSPMHTLQTHLRCSLVPQ